MSTACATESAQVFNRPPEMRWGLLAVHPHCPLSLDVSHLISLAFALVSGSQFLIKSLISKFRLSSPPIKVFGTFQKEQS